MTTRGSSAYGLKPLDIVSAEDYATLQAAIDANPGKAIYAPAGGYGSIVVEDDNTLIYGAEKSPSPKLQGSLKA